VSETVKESTSDPSVASNEVVDAMSEETLVAQKTAAQKAAMRAALANVDLTPEQTRDDIAPPSPDRDYLADVPPHHGGH